MDKSLQLRALTMTVLIRAALMVWEVVAGVGLLLVFFALLGLILLVFLYALGFAINITPQLIDLIKGV